MHAVAPATFVWSFVSVVMLDGSLEFRDSYLCGYRLRSHSYAKRDESIGRENESMSVCNPLQSCGVQTHPVRTTRLENNEVRNPAACRIHSDQRPGWPPRLRC